VKFRFERGVTKLVSIRDFALYYTLVRRLSDLLALKKLEVADEDLGACSAQLNSLTECIICCNETSNSILPCNHRICETCERHWVRKRLECPFCRTRFKSVKEIRNCSWNLSEFSATELQHDLETLNNQIGQFWKSCRFIAIDEDVETIGTYEAVGRGINVALVEEEE